MATQLTLSDPSAPGKREHGPLTKVDKTEQPEEEEEDAVFFSHADAENKFGWRRCLHPEVKAHAV